MTEENKQERKEKSIKVLTLSNVFLDREEKERIICLWAYTIIPIC